MSAFVMHGSRTLWICTKRVQRREIRIRRLNSARDGARMPRREKRQAFELFRGQQSDVEIITFDEMYERTSRLIDVLEGNIQS